MQKSVQANHALGTHPVRAAGCVVLCVQGDIVVRQGDMGSEMYFVGEGALEVREPRHMYATTRHM